MVGEHRLGVGVRSLVAVIRFYQFFSHRLPRQCRFYPSCSHYASEALVVHGLVAGIVLSVKRLGRCHPFSMGGLDPVPSPHEGRCHC